MENFCFGLGVFFSICIAGYFLYYSGLWVYIVALVALAAVLFIVFSVRSQNKKERKEKEQYNAWIQYEDNENN